MVILVHEGHGISVDDAFISLGYYPYKRILKVSVAPALSLLEATLFHLCP